MVITGLSAREIEHKEGLLWQLPRNSVALVVENVETDLAVWLATEEEVVSRCNKGRLEFPTSQYCNYINSAKIVRMWEGYWTINNPRLSRLYMVASFCNLQGDGLW